LNAAEWQDNGNEGDVVCLPDVLDRPGAVGTYDLSYTLPDPGRYLLHIRLRRRPVVSSPFTLVVTAPSDQARPPLSPHERRSSPSKIPLQTRPVDRSPARPVTGASTGTKRPASSPPSNRSLSLVRPRSSAPALTSSPSVNRSQQQGTRACSATRRRPRFPGLAASHDAWVSASHLPASPLPVNGDVFGARICRTSRAVVSSLDCSQPAPPCPAPRTPDSPMQQSVAWPPEGLEDGPAGRTGMEAAGCSSLVMRVGTQGRERGEFVNPQGVCCTRDGLVLVADSNNACIQVNLYKKI
jgi:hypothetical protein